MQEEIISREISLMDESLNKQETSNYNLYVQLSLQEMAYCIMDTQRNKFIGFESYAIEETYNAYRLAEAVDKIIENNKWLCGSFKETKIIYVNNKSTLVPVPLFDAKEEEIYFNFNHNLDDSEDLYCDKMNNLNAYNLYALPTVIKSKLREHFNDYKLYHYLTTYIESLLMINKNRLTEKNIFVNVNSNTFDAILLDGNRLTYNNTFQYHTASDLIYYLMFALQQLDLNPEQVNLTLTGNVEKQSEVYDMIYKYVRNVGFMKRNDAYQYSYVLDKIAGHGYFNLFNTGLVQ